MKVYRKVLRLQANQASDHQRCLDGCEPSNLFFEELENGDGGDRDDKSKTENANDFENATGENSDAGIPTVSPVVSALQRRLDDIAGNGTEDLNKIQCDIMDLQCLLVDDLSTVFCEEVVMSAEQDCEGTVAITTIDEKQVKKSNTLIVNLKVLCFRAIRASGRQA